MVHVLLRKRTLQLGLVLMVLLVKGYRRGVRGPKATALGQGRPTLKKLLGRPKIFAGKKDEIVFLLLYFLVKPFIHLRKLCLRTCLAGQHYDVVSRETMK